MEHEPGEHCADRQQDERDQDRGRALVRMIAAGADRQFVLAGRMRAECLGTLALFRRLAVMRVRGGSAMPMIFGVVMPVRIM